MRRSCTDQEQFARRGASKTNYKDPGSIQSAHLAAYEAFHSSEGNEPVWSNIAIFPIRYLRPPEVNPNPRALLRLHMRNMQAAPPDIKTSHVIADRNCRDAVDFADVVLERLRN